MENPADDMSDSSVELVPNPDNSVEDEEDIVPDTDNTTKKRKRVEYSIEREFENSTEALAFVAAEKKWSIRRKTNTEEGAKTFYRCNLVKQRRAPCAAVVYLLYDATGSRVFLFRGSEGHTCDTMDDDVKSGPKLTDEVIKVIKELHDQKKKPMAIREALTLMKLPVPKLYTIKFQIAKYKKEKYGPTSISMSELRELLNQYTDIPDADEKPYVLHDINADAEHFRFFMTTKSLISNAAQAVSINADATYKLMWQGFPCLIVGTTDASKKFHIIGVSVCTSETEADFVFLFRAMQQCAADLLNIEISPAVIVCDAAHAISNAFKSVFGETSVVVMCWAHMMRNVKKKLQKLVKSKATQGRIIADIRFLQLIATVQQFETALELFLHTWSTHTDFINYFKAEWVVKNGNWYEGVMQRVPSTNNALEATNNIIKVKYTFRDRLSLGEFISVMVVMLASYSRRCNDDLQFAKAAFITKDNYEKAYQWKRLKLPLVIKTTDNTKSIIVESAKSRASLVKPVMMPNPTTLEQFKDGYSSHWIVSLASGENKWLDAQCSCPEFQKEYMCKHVVGIAARFGEITIPEEAKSVPIGAKPTRGRPAKAKKALLTQ